MKHSTEASPPPQDIVVELLVQEFRACQRLSELLMEERSALLREDAPASLSLLRQIEFRLHALAQHEEARRTIFGQLGLVFGSDPFILTQTRRSHNLDSQTVRRLVRLQSGIQTLRGNIREQVRNTILLASAALEHSNILQQHLVLQASLPVEDTTLQAAKDNTLLPAILSALVTTRDALNTGSLANASNNLQSLLAELDLSLNTNVENIAVLYQQGMTYRAILHTSQKLLQSVY